MSLTSAVEAFAPQMTAEETQQQLSDEFRSEREKLYKESAAEAERILQEQLEEEQRKAAEKLRRYEELVEQLESDLTKAEVEGEKIEEEFKQFMEQENRKAGVLDEDLEDYFNQNFQEGLVWPDEDYANCSEAIERANEDFRQNLEEKLQEKVEAVRQQVQKDEEKLTEDYLVFEEQLKKRREEIEQEYQTRTRGTRDPKKLEKIQKDRDHKLGDLEAKEKLNTLQHLPFGECFKDCEEEDLCTHFVYDGSTRAPSHIFTEITFLLLNDPTANPNPSTTV